ncbi:MAG: hypothetical protein IKC84_01430 [Helicobacteraceae bacterium]|nr:hypothetical protein [Helicobacteraceae bacterium]
MNNVDITHRFHLKGSILSINQSNNDLIIITQHYSAFKINKTMRLKELAVLLNSKELPHRYSKTTSANANLISLAESSSNILSIAEIQESARIITRLDDHKKTISASRFSNDNNILASGGEDGRVHIYDTNKFQKIITLPYRPDYISSINFSKDSRFLFASCFNKSNMVFDYQRTKITNIFNTNEVVEWADFFDNNSKLFIVLRNSNSIIYDIRANQTINISTPFTSWPSVFCINDDEKLAIVGSRDSTIYVINLKENTKVFDIKLDNASGISALYLYLGKIFVGFTNGELIIINYNDKDNEFMESCNKKDYPKASKMLDKNIFLSLLPCAKIFDDDWEDVLKDAVKLLSYEKIDEATNLVEPFIRDERKKEAFNFYLNSKDTLKKFRTLIDEKAYEEAYNMALQIKFLLKTSYFEDLENIWHKAFNYAKKIIEENPNNAESAKKILGAFLKTPKKPAIMQLLNNINIFKDAENLVKEQNFKEYFLLTSNFSYLKDTELYKKVLILGDNIYQKALNYENNKQYDEFEKLARFLQNFPSYKDIITSYLISTSKKLEMLDFIAKNKKDKVYKLALEFEELQYLSEFKDYCKEFDTLYKQAKDLAFNGKIDELESIFQDYIKIEYWSKNIKNIYKIAYIQDFKNHINDTINWTKTINNYIDIFGKDDDIIDFCTKNKLEDSMLESDDDERIKTTFKYQKTLIQQ